MTDWDYCILSPRLINLKILDRFYPPKLTIERETIKRVVNAALVERENKFDFQGSELINRNRPLEALPLLEKAYEYNPINFLLPYSNVMPTMNGFYYLGLAYYGAGQYQEAARYLESTAGKMGNPAANRMAILYCGQAYLQLKNYNNALAFFEEGLRQTPGDRNILTALVNTCTLMGDQQRASAYLEQLQAQ